MSFDLKKMVTIFCIILSYANTIDAVGKNKRITHIKHSEKALKTPKIAFLFLTVGDIHHKWLWRKFFKVDKKSRLSKVTHASSIYVHAKIPLSNNSWFKKYTIAHTIKTSWCNTMHAQIELLRKALKDKANEKFIFLSETTIPIKSFEQTYRKVFSHPLSEFSFVKNPNHERMFPPLPKDVIYKNWQWVILNRKHAQMMVNDRDIINIMSKQCCDNEHYPSTFLVNKGLSSEIVPNDTTFVYWLNNGKPFLYEDLTLEIEPVTALINAIKNPDYLFARKFSKKCDLSPLRSYTAQLPL